MGPVRLCVLVSGSGTILEAMIDEGLPLALVGSDRPCRGLDVAAAASIDTVLVNRRAFGGFGDTFDREAYTDALTNELVSRDIDLVAMAGFGTILAASFHRALPGRVLNTHPSLLPLFKGWHAVRATLEAGVAETGCTVHVATEELDEGPILAQRRVAVRENDDEDSLHERIKEAERTLYPAVVARVMATMTEGHEPSSVAGTWKDT